MKISRLKIALLLLCCVAIAFEVWHFRSSSTLSRQSPTPIAQKGKPDFALLPADEIPAAVGYFALSGPHAESWEPTLGDIEDAEANLSQISPLSRLDPNPDSHIDDPRQYFRQYLAVVVDGKKMILLNAFCADQTGADGWRRHLVFGLDGGKCFWHASYDPVTGKFSDLKVNGIG